MRDPNTGFLFNLQPLASEQGYTVTGNGRTFSVRILTVQSVVYEHCCCIFFVLLSDLVELSLSPLRKYELAGKHVVEGRNER